MAHEGTTEEVGETQSFDVMLQALRDVKEGQQKINDTQTQLLQVLASLTEAVKGSVRASPLDVPPPAAATAQNQEVPSAREQHTTALLRKKAPAAAFLLSGGNPGAGTSAAGVVDLEGGGAASEKAASAGGSAGPETQYMTMADVQALLMRERAKAGEYSLPCPDIQPPYPLNILSLPYPEGYVPPKFVKFEGKEGSAHKHVVRFIESLGPFAVDYNLRLREFSKFLTARAKGK